VVSLVPIAVLSVASWLPADGPAADLYRALIAAPGPGEAAAVEDQVDPVPWTGARALTAESLRRATAALEAYLAADPEDRALAPLQRAFLMHDLWALSDHLARSDLLQEAEETREAREALGGRLRRAMSALALPPSGIEALPDTLALASAAGRYPARWDAEATDRAFLPRGLGSPDGDWICLGDEGGTPFTPFHHAVLMGRSAFLVYFRHPDGREAGLAWIASMRAFLRAAAPPEPGREDGFPIDRTPPAPPTGSMFALVRRMLLPDSGGVVRATPITETVQIRVYPVAETRAVFELELSRDRAVAHHGDGLRAIRPGESRRVPLLGGARLVVLESCTACHAFGADHAFLNVTSVVRFGFHESPPLPRGLCASTPAREIAAVIRARG